MEFYAKMNKYTKIQIFFEKRTDLHHSYSGSGDYAHHKKSKRRCGYAESIRIDFLYGHIDFENHAASIDRRGQKEYRRRLQGNGQSQQCRIGNLFKGLSVYVTRKHRFRQRKSARAKGFSRYKP